LDRIRAAGALPEPAQRYTAEELSAAIDGGYGGFTGAAAHLAILRFQPLHARWAADERWHPAQTSEVLPDGRFELRVPYGEPFELLMDIQRYGAGVEVVSPPALREALRNALQSALAQYLPPSP
jgi:predicted DNA-binding transcriptional regulator YafY